jgi:hypothetical protein
MEINGPLLFRSCFCYHGKRSIYPISMEHMDRGNVVSDLYPVHPGIQSKWYTGANLNFYSALDQRVSDKLQNCFAVITSVRR